MRIIKKSNRKNPKVSMVLLDWSVRESFHLLHYLRKQTVPRDDFEVIIIEYYDRVSDKVKEFEDQVDTWVVLDMPEDCYYHKHLMYNIGIVLGRGEIVMIGDSDAMVRETFIGTIIKAFDKDPKIVYHLDQFRNMRRDFYPFNYPSFEEVLGDGCINIVDGKTIGIVEQEIPLHTRNYGACMCARREDMIDIGGADEDMTYLGHICGPYDITFRLMNFSRRLIWEEKEYLYHTWHPGSDGVDNYVGPHDGKGVSTTALKALTMGRSRPLVENAAIKMLRENPDLRSKVSDKVIKHLINPDYWVRFNKEKLGGAAQKPIQAVEEKKGLFAEYKGMEIFFEDGVYYGVPGRLSGIDMKDKKKRSTRGIMRALTFQELKDRIDRFEARVVETIGQANIIISGDSYYVVPHWIGPVDFLDEVQRKQAGIRETSSLELARKIPARSDFREALLSKVVRKISGILRRIIYKTICLR